MDRFDAIRFMIFFLLMFLVVTTFIVLMRYHITRNNLASDFCEDHGYEYGGIDCYKFEGDFLITRDIAYRDGRFYWVEASKK